MVCNNNAVILPMNYFPARRPKAAEAWEPWRGARRRCVGFMQRCAMLITMQFERYVSFQMALFGFDSVSFSFFLYKILEPGLNDVVAEMSLMRIDHK
mmetsp:Transcript_20102/g.37854  ORF Transcript_20102/g.37854 Transcript_20102/m.37854 type:complete len:97 (-) Transcript_20102:1538-1828(-)